MTKQAQFAPARNVKHLLDYATGWCRACGATFRDRSEPCAVSETGEAPHTLTPLHQRGGE